MTTVNNNMETYNSCTFHSSIQMSTISGEFKSQIIQMTRRINLCVSQCSETQWFKKKVRRYMYKYGVKLEAGYTLEVLSLINCKRDNFYYTLYLVPICQNFPFFYSGVWIADVFALLASILFKFISILPSHNTDSYGTRSPLKILVSHC